MIFNLLSQPHLRFSWVRLRAHFFPYVAFDNEQRVKRTIFKEGSEGS